MRLLRENPEGEVPSLFSRPPGCEFHPRCRFALDRCTTIRPAWSLSTATHGFACHNPG